MAEPPTNNDDDTTRPNPRPAFTLCWLLTRPRRQAVPGVVAHFLHRRKTSPLAGPPPRSLEPSPTPTLERHRGRHPPGPFVEVSVAPTLQHPGPKSMSPSMRGGPATPSNNASRRRPAGPMNADPRQDVQTVFHPKNFRNRSTVSKSGCTTAVPGADPTVCCRVLHRIFLTLRISCGARAPLTIRHGPPARRQLQPVVSHRHDFQMEVRDVTFQMFPCRATRY